MSETINPFERRKFESTKDERAWELAAQLAELASKLFSSSAAFYDAAHQRYISEKEGSTERGRNYPTHTEYGIIAEVAAKASSELLSYSMSFGTREEIFLDKQGDAEHATKLLLKSLDVEDGDERASEFRALSTEITNIAKEAGLDIKE